MQCDKCFVSIQGLVHHQRIHTGERRYACSVCCISFIKSSDLAVHEKTIKHRTTINEHKDIDDSALNIEEGTVKECKDGQVNTEWAEDDPDLLLIVHSDIKQISQVYLKPVRRVERNTKHKKSVSSQCPDSVYTSLTESVEVRECRVVVDRCTHDCCNTSLYICTDCFNLFTYRYRY